MKLGLTKLYWFFLGNGVFLPRCAFDWRFFNSMTVIEVFLDVNDRLTAMAGHVAKIIANGVFARIS